MWKQLSDEIQAIVGASTPRLAHVGGAGIPGRTALIWADGVLVTLARQAQDGETVPVVVEGRPTEATVRAWDPRTGLTLLSVPDVVARPWAQAALPGTGALVLTVAYPSPQGVEARLDLVRFVGGASEWGRGVSLQALLQTDGGAFPGFTGGAVVDEQGGLVGFVADNRSGNGGFVIPAADLAALVEKLLVSGSPRPAWLGVSTRPGGGQGLALVAVEPDSPAQRAGWRAGDLLVLLAGRPLREPQDLLQLLAGLEAGSEIPARLLRDGALVDLPVIAGAR